MSGTIGEPSQSWTGGTVAEGIQCVLAPNPSPWTLEGTNTWVIGTMNSGCVVVDPGPADPGHLRKVADAIPGEIRAILLTHAHIDHSEGAPELAELLRVPVISHREIEGLDLGDMTLRMHKTPGHSSDSVCVTVSNVGGNYLLTGDTVLGRGTTLVAHPDGRLDEYFESLRYLRDHCLEQNVDTLLPGHGPISRTPVELIAFYEAHRRERLEQVRAAVSQGALTVAEVTAVVYSDVDPQVLPAAEMTVAAQLEFLKEQNT